MRKTAIITISLILAMVTGLSGCITSTPPAPPTPVAASSPTVISRTFDIAMTGVHIEHFDFQRGDSVAGQLTVDGKYPVSFTVVYYQSLAGQESTAMALILDIEETLLERFTFVAPVSTTYQFWFDIPFTKTLEDDKPYRGLWQRATLDLTIHRE